MECRSMVYFNLYSNSRDNLRIFYLYNYISSARLGNLISIARFFNYRIREVISSSKPTCSAFPISQDCSSFYTLLTPRLMRSVKFLRSFYGEGIWARFVVRESSTIRDTKIPSIGDAYDGQVPSDYWASSTASRYYRKRRVFRSLSIGTIESHAVSYNDGLNKPKVFT